MLILLQAKHLTEVKIGSKSMSSDSSFSDSPYEEQNHSCGKGISVVASVDSGRSRRLLIPRNTEVSGKQTRTLLQAGPHLLLPLQLQRCHLDAPPETLLSEKEAREIAIRPTIRAGSICDRLPPRSRRRSSRFRPISPRTNRPNPRHPAKCPSQCPTHLRQTTRKR